MNKGLRYGTAAVAAAMLGAAAFRLALPSPARADASDFSDGQVKSIETIVKNYLIAHPEVLAEVQVAYEKKAEAKEIEDRAAKMPDLYKSLAGLKDELAPFAVGTGDVTMVEFFDYNCPYCRQNLPEVVKLLDTDKHLKVLFMELPILSPASTEASKIAVAAAKQGKYFEFHKAMLTEGHAGKQSALKVAERLGLDMPRVEADAASPETAALIGKIADIAQRALINGTPSFIAGDKTNASAANYATLEELVSNVRKDGCKACVKEAGVGEPTGELGAKKS